MSKGENIVIVHSLQVTWREWRRIGCSKRSTLKNWKGRGEGEDPGKDGKRKEKEIFKCWEWEDGESWWRIEKNGRILFDRPKPKRAVVPMEGEEEDALISQIYFWNKTVHASDSSTVHQQEFFTVHTTMVYVVQVCWQLASTIRTELRNCSSVQILLASCQQTCVTYTYCCVYSEKLLMMDRGNVRNMWSFIPKINLRS